MKKLLVLAALAFALAAGAAVGTVTLMGPAVADPCTGSNC